MQTSGLEKYIRIKKTIDTTLTMRIGIALTQIMLATIVLLRGCFS